MGQITTLGNDATGSGKVVLATNPVLTGATLTGTVPNIATITGDGAITIATGTVILSKGTAAAITLAAPSSQDGTKIAIISNSNAAHVITFPSAICFDGTTGGNTTITFAAFKGAAVTLIAVGVTWLTESLNLVTPAP